MDSRDPIEKALDLRPLSETKEDKNSYENLEEDKENELPVVNENENTELSTNTETPPEVIESIQDIELARENIKNLIESGNSSLEELIDVAKQSENPRAYEVVSGLMKTLLDANKDFIDVSTKRKYAKEEVLNPKEQTSSSTNVTNNNLILSTSDLLEMIKGEKEE